MQQRAIRRASKTESPSLLTQLRDLDAYAKPLDDFQVKTAIGGTVTLLSTLFILFLLASEFADWATVELKPALKVDSGRKEKMTIHFNISFPHIPCFLVGIDVMDVSGEHQNDVDHDIFKQRITRNGEWINEKERSIVGLKTSKEAVDAKKELQTGSSCGSCYGAESAEKKCCQTCDDVKRAYEAKGWTMDELDKYQQCIDDGVVAIMEEQKSEGCNLHGTLQVNKVGGNIHFAPGKSYTLNGIHAHDIHDYVKSDKYDWTHWVHNLGFGEVVGFENPLDGIKKTSDQGWSHYQYFVKVVRTDFSFRNGTTVSTNQYSVTEHEKITPPSLGSSVSMPGVFFTLEISPMLITYTEHKKPFTHFLTDTCAIIGGIFTVAGLIDGFIYTAEKRFKQKMEIGKGH